MKLGVMSDTHNCSKDSIREIVGEFKQRGVQEIVHCGDILHSHTDTELFGDFPVTCVLTKDQAFSRHFAFPPAKWRFVRPSYPENPPQIVGKLDDSEASQVIREQAEFCERQRIFARLVPLGDLFAYCGHERSFDALNRPEKVHEFFRELNQVKDGVYLAMTGHTHHQFLYRNNNVFWVNPGAVEMSWNSTVEFAVIDTDKRQVVFGRLSKAEAKMTPVTVGLLADTGVVSELDVNFWERASVSFQERGVTKVICCGDFRPQDIGRPELKEMEVHYYLLPGMEASQQAPNWHLISHEHPIVEICGHNFYVQHGIGSEQANFSEIQRDEAFRDLFARYKRLEFIVAGLTSDTIYMEGQNYSFLDPGDARDHKCVGTICLPRRELDFYTIPG